MSSPAGAAAAEDRAAGRRRVRMLALHADYRCRHSGACCSSGWEIPVEQGLEGRLRSALADGRLRLPVRGGSPGPSLGPLTSGPLQGARSALVCADDGRCVFLDASSRLCAIHRQLGEAALPVACRQFPRVATLAPGAVSLTLSHYCPTAASLLFRADLPDGRDPWLEIVENPPAFSAAWDLEGLDARRGFPLLRPGVFMSWAAFESWERHIVAVLARDGGPGGRPPSAAPESALARLTEDAERLRAWTPADGDFDEYLDRILARGREAEPATGLSSTAGPSPFEAWAQVAATVPARHPRPLDPSAALPAADRQAIDGLVHAGWHALASPIRRWLAAKAFASWVALQGEGLRTHVLALRSALAVLRAETLRGCGEARRALDAELLLQAIRRTDLLLVNLADTEVLAKRLSRCEGGAC